MIFRSLLKLCIQLLIFLSPYFVLAQQFKSNTLDQGTGEAFSYSIDNDSRLLGGPGSDNAYSSGFKLSYIYAEDKLPKWAEPILGPFNFVATKMKTSRYNYGLSFSQQIYTPNDKDVRELIPSDRPYAGWMYFGFFFSTKEPTQAHLFEVDLGAIGPIAQGEYFQNNIHRFLGINQAAGWENQLRNEPTLNLSYVQKIKGFDLRTKNRTYFDVIPEWGMSAGNVLIGARAGLSARLGTQLPDNFGPSRPSASDGETFVSTGNESKDRPKNFYVFAGFRGNAIAHDIFLDGNTFEDSHRIRKRPLIFETDLGFSLQYFPWSLVWRFTTKSPEFYGREKSNSFASVNASYHFGL